MPCEKGVQDITPSAEVYAWPGGLPPFHAYMGDERSALTGERHRVAVPVPCMSREPLCPDAEPSASFTEHRYTGC